MTIRTWGITTLALAGLTLGCGDDGGGGIGGSYDSVVGAIESPTGTVDATTTPDVVAELDAALDSDAPTPLATELAGSVAKQSFGAAYCTGGGDIAVGNVSESGATIDYQGCCIEGCCIDGTASVYYSMGGTYSTCSSYDLTTTCSGSETVSTVYNGCVDAQGRMVYAIEVNGESFAVSIVGSYYDGTGTLEIQGGNGSFTCTLTDYAGSCEGDGTSFDI